MEKLEVRQHLWVFCNCTRFSSGFHRAVTSGYKQDLNRNAKAVQRLLGKNMCVYIYIHTQCFGLCGNVIEAQKLKKTVEKYANDQPRRLGSLYENYELPVMQADGLGNESVVGFSYST